MFLAYLFFLLAECLLVEYKFSINFGKFFWDYSGNNHHGENQLSSNTIYLTDRGIYLLSTDSRINTPDNLQLPTSVTYLAWVMPTDSEFRLLFRVKDTNNRYHLGRKASTNAVYIHVDFGGTADKYGPNESFPASQWSLVVLRHDGTSFHAYVNTVLQVSLTHSFSIQFSGFKTGVGTYFASSFTVVHAFVWNYVIMAEAPTYSSYFDAAGSSNCLLKAGTCSSCSFAIVDSSLGAGCLSTNMDYTKSSSGGSCGSTSYGCSATTQYYCSSTTQTCEYDRFSNTCSMKMIVSPYTQKNISCTCQSGYTSINNQCCISGCATCDMTGACLTCKRTNSYVLLGKCYCNDGFYESSSTVCTACNPGCKTCSSIDPCISCWDTHMIESSKICLCNHGYYSDSLTTCSPCNSGCKTCSSLDLCLSCWDSNMNEIGYICECKDGFFANSSNSCASCNLGCKTCNSTDPCIDCFEISMIKSDNTCTCPDGYYTILNTSCIPCNSGCLACSSSNPCISCYPNMLKTKYYCVCDRGYYNINSESCGICNSGCKTCNSTNLCVECFDKNMIILDNICQCNYGYYLENPENCLPCNTGCKICSSSKLCSECYNSIAINIGDSCICPEGYYIYKNDKCTSCSLECKTCNNSNTCLSCISLKSFLTPEGNCKCSEGYFNETSLFNKNSCKKCNNSCSACVSYNYCLNCSKRYQKPDNNGICQCEENFIYQQGKCICPSGFILKKNICTDYYFYLEISVNKANKLYLKFSQTPTNFTLSRLKFSIESIKFSVNLFQSTSKNYSITINTQDTINHNSTCIIEI